jgi:hypothetical protein
VRLTGGLGVLCGDQGRGAESAGGVAVRARTESARPGPKDDPAPDRSGSAATQLQYKTLDFPRHCNSSQAIRDKR